MKVVHSAPGWNIQQHRHFDGAEYKLLAHTKAFIYWGCRIVLASPFDSDERRYHLSKITVDSR